MIYLNHSATFISDDLVLILPLVLLDIIHTYIWWASQLQGGSTFDKVTSLARIYFVVCFPRAQSIIPEHRGGDKVYEVVGVVMKVVLLLREAEHDQDKDEGRQQEGGHCQ